MCAGCEDCVLIDPTKPKVAWEYHATVNEPWEDFRLFCDVNGVKAIRVEDLFRDGSTRISVMTSHKIVGHVVQPAYHEYRRVFDLINDKFKVVRNKLEVAPWCNGVPITPEDYIEVYVDSNGDSYFEVHFQFNEDTVELREELWKHGLHLSRNVDKPGILMATFRYDTWFEKFEKGVKRIKSKLQNLPLDKRIIIEYTAYDTNKGYDSSWMSSG